MYSIIVTGARGEPRTLPRWGIPPKSRCTSDALAKRVDDDGEDEEPPLTARATPTAAPISTMSSPTAMSTFDDAARRSPFRCTGGGAARARRRLLCFPLAIASQGSDGAG